MNHSAEKDAWLSDLADRCRERLDSLPDWALPTWYRFHGRVIPSAECPCQPDNSTYPVDISCPLHGLAAVGADPRDVPSETSDQ